MPRIESPRGVNLTPPGLARVNTLFNIATTNPHFNY